jgi:hypothetical protein
MNQHQLSDRLVNPVTPSILLLCVILTLKLIATGVGHRPRGKGAGRGGRQLGVESSLEAHARECDGGFTISYETCNHSEQTYWDIRCGHACTSLHSFRF